MKNFKEHLLDAAESFDAWRVVPRMMLLSYGYLVWHLYMWYRSIAVYTQTKCDGVILQLLLDHGMTFLQARDLACNIVGTVGGPTGEQTVFVTTIIGLSTGIFALYTTTGRKWAMEQPMFFRPGNGGDSSHGSSGGYGNGGYGSSGGYGSGNKGGNNHNPHGGTSGNNHNQHDNPHGKPHGGKNDPPR